MAKTTSKAATPSLDVTMAGVHFRSPIGVSAVGRQFGKYEAYRTKTGAEIDAQVLLKHIRAGAGYVYVGGIYITEATLVKLRERAKLDETPRLPDTMGVRAMRAVTPVAPYGVEGIYQLVSPFLLTPELSDLADPTTEKTIQILKEKKPEDVRIIASVTGFGDLADAFVDGAKRSEELGADLIELNLSCGLPAGMKGAVDNFFQKRFPAFCQGSLLGDQPDIVEEITREVVKAVRIPVGVKLTAETGFPRIVGIAKSIRDAGAKYIQLINTGIGIAPPDIYNRGRPLWPFMDGNPFCIESGSWLRGICYRDVAAIARFVPGIDIAASGGLVMPEHCVEVMMLGATLTQLCSGVIEQGRGLIRRSTDFMKKFMVEQGYQSVKEIIGLGQQYIKYQEDVNMMVGQVVAELDEDKCTRCGHCLDNLCIALYSDHGKIRVREEVCAGCGYCILACQPGALKLVAKE